MKSYNGFSPEQRYKSLRWLNAEWSAGRLQRPIVCCACGQTEGRIDAHAEDYNEPFAAGKTDEFPLCFVCHMMVHCRYRNHQKWDQYRQIISRGGQYRAALSWPAFMERFLSGGLPHPDVMRAAPERRPLDEIETRPKPTVLVAPASRATERAPERERKPARSLFMRL